MDKPLSEQLTALAEWLESEAYDLVVDGHRDMAIALDTKAAEVRAMAERVKGKCLLTPFIVDLRSAYTTEEISTGHRVRAFAMPTEGPGYGETTEQALANLQSLLDQRKE